VIRNGTAFALGVVAGVLIPVAGFLVVNRDTVVLETKATVVAGGIVIPKGTLLVHDAEMSEGFDRLALYLNVDPITLERAFLRRVDSRPLLRPPYWLTESPSTSKIVVSTVPAAAK
jgi:hypothetical protein